MAIVKGILLATAAIILLMFLIKGALMLLTKMGVITNEIEVLLRVMGDRFLTAVVAAIILVAIVFALLGKYFSYWTSRLIIKITIVLVAIYTLLPMLSSPVGIVILVATSVLVILRGIKKRRGY